MKTKTDDDILLQQFFAEHQHHMADNGFTERVMAMLPAREDAAVLTLRRWKIILDTVVVLCAICLIVMLGMHLWHQMHAGTIHIMNGSITIFHNMSMLLDPDNLLVQLIYFLRRLAGVLPSPTQLLVLFLTILVLLPITIKAALRR